MKKHLILALKSVVGFEDQLPGGLADDRHPREFPEEKLNQGVRVELEHTDDPTTALEIVMDHLTEDINYYDKLAEIEDH